MARPKSTPMQEEAKKVVKKNLERLMGSMSQVELSERSGIPKQTINGYVKGTSLPTPGNTEKLSRVFDVLKSDIDPRFKSDAFKESDLEEAKKKLSTEESVFFEMIIEKTLSLGESDREDFLANMRFAIELIEKKSK